MRIAALADIHLGFRGLKVRVRGRHAREQDVEKAWLTAVQQVCAARPDLITVAGDVFHSPVVSNYAIHAWLKGLRQLLDGTRADIVVVVGNHDAAKTSDTLTPLQLTHAGLEDMDIGRVHLCAEARTFNVLGGQARVTALPYVGGVRKRFELPEPDPGVPNICVVHSKLDAPALPKFYAQDGVSLNVLMEFFDVICAGDYHEHVILAAAEWDTLHGPGTTKGTIENGTCTAFYSGALERAVTNPWHEDFAHGWVLHDTETKKTRHIAVPTRRMLDEHLRLDPADDGPEAVNAELDRLLAEDDTRDAMVRLVVTGFDKTQKRGINWTTVRRLKQRALHFQLDLRARETETLTLADRRTERQTLEELARAFFKGDDAPVRQRCLGYIDPSWRSYTPREEVVK